LRVGEHETLPLAADERQRNRCGADASRATLDGAQRVERVEDRPAGTGRLERHDLKQRRQEAPQARVATQQLRPERRVLAAAVELGWREATDRFAGGVKLIAADASADRRPQRIKAAGRRVEQHEHRGAQPPRGAIELGQLLEALVLVLAGGLGEQLIDDLVKQHERVVSGVELELPQRRQQGRVAALGVHPAQGLRLRDEAIAGQRPLAAHRHVDVDAPDADVAHVAQAQKRLQQFGRRELARPRPQPLKTRDCLVRRDLEQRP
jgi:hypothetical protein